MMDEAREEKAAIEAEKKRLDTQYESCFGLLRRLKQLRFPQAGEVADIGKKIDALIDWAIMTIERELEELLLDSQEVVDDKLEIEEEFKGDDVPEDGEEGPPEEGDDPLGDGGGGPSPME